MIFVLSGRFLFCQEFEEFENISLITYPLRAVNVNSLFLKLAFPSAAERCFSNS